MFKLTFNNDTIAGESNFIAIKLTMKGDAAIRIACDTILKEIPTMQMRNAKQTFTIMKRHALHIIKTGEGMMPNVGQYALQKSRGSPNADGMSVYFDRDLSFRYGDKQVMHIQKTIPMPYKQSWKTRYDGFADSTARNHPLGRLSGELYDGVLKTENGTAYTISETLVVGKKGDMKGKDRIKSDQVDTNITTVFSNPEYIRYVHEGKPGVMPRPFFRIATSRAEKDVSDVLRKNVKAFRIGKIYEAQEAKTLESRLGDLPEGNPYAVYPYFTFEMTDSKFKNVPIPLDYGTRKRPTARGKRGAAKKTKTETHFDQVKKQYRQDIDTQTAWEAMKKKARGRRV